MVALSVMRGSSQMYAPNITTPPLVWYPCFLPRTIATPRFISVQRSTANTGGRRLVNIPIPLDICYLSSLSIPSLSAYLPLSPPPLSLSPHTHRWPSVFLLRWRWARGAALNKPDEPIRLRRGHPAALSAFNERARLLTVRGRTESDRARPRFPR